MTPRKLTDADAKTVPDLAGLSTEMTPFSRTLHWRRVTAARWFAFDQGRADRAVWTPQETFAVTESR